MINRSFDIPEGFTKSRFSTAMGCLESRASSVGMPKKGLVFGGWSFWMSQDDFRGTFREFEHFVKARI